MYFCREIIYTISDLIAVIKKRKAANHNPHIVYLN